MRFQDEFLSVVQWYANPTGTRDFRTIDQQPPRSLSQLEFSLAVIRRLKSS